MKIRLALLLGALGASTNGGSATELAADEPLSPGVRLQREIAPPALSHAYDLSLEADAFVRLTVQPRGNDAVVTLAGPAGEPLGGADDAGADRVVASLWRVDDAATAALMTRFYTAMLGRRRLRPAAALRAAQLDLMRQPRFRHPFFWGAFRLQGEWR